MLDIEKREWRCGWIDVLRTVLALYVVFAHAVPWVGMLYSDHQESLSDRISNALNAFAQPHGETNLAVLAFIVLSGYCIHRSGIQHGLKAFGIRRAFRILPVYVIASLFGMVVFALSINAFPLIASVNETNAITGSCALAKLSTASAFFPGLSRCAFQGNAPLRTVAPEIWLYAAYPIGLLLIRSFGEKAFWALLGAIWIVGFLLSYRGGHLGWWRNDSFFGFLLYWWIGAKALDYRFASALRWAAIPALIVWASIPGFSHPLAVELRQLCVAIAFAALITIIDVKFISRTIERFGRAGYSIYAFHAPIIYLSIAAGLTWQVAFVFAAISGSMLFYLIELPMEGVGKEAASNFSKRPY
jgi:peptidoglycan/LPS O-acetylase OafA/YrhL